MKRNGNKKTGTTILCAALFVVLPFLMACGSTQQENQLQTVQVRVTDHHIEMPAEVPAGPTTFEVTNTGSSEHSLGITGPAGDQMLETPLKPGESATLEMGLDTGTYRVYCPVEQSHGGNMQVALHVRPDAGGSKG